MFAFVRSSGPGGQNVNKRSTKVQARWRVSNSLAFTPEEKAIISSRIASRLTREGELIVESDVERSQPQNRKRAVRLLQKLVGDALVQKKKRKTTRPTRASHERRLQTKVRQSQKKTLRANVDAIE